MQTDKQGSAAEKTPGSDEQQDRPGNTGKGAESAMNRMRQLERSRAELRGSEGEPSGDPGE